MTYGPEAFIVAWNVRFSVAPLAISKPDQVNVCVAKSNEPELETVPGTKEYPVGKTSSTLTPVASEFDALALLLKIAIVNVTTSPTFPVVGDTDLDNSKSETGIISIVT